MRSDSSISRFARPRHGAAGFTLLAFLVSNLAFPTHAYALRQHQLETQDQRSGLEEALREHSTSNRAAELPTSPSASVQPVSIRLQSISRAGMEELELALLKLVAYRPYVGTGIYVFQQNPSLRFEAAVLFSNPNMFGRKPRPEELEAFVGWFLAEAPLGWMDYLYPALGNQETLIPNVSVTVLSAFVQGLQSSYRMAPQDWAKIKEQLTTLARPGALFVKARFHHFPDPETIALSPDGSTLAVQRNPSFHEGEEDIVRFWDVLTGQPRGELKFPHLQGAEALTFSPTGSILAVHRSEAGGGLVELRDTQTKELLHELVSLDAGQSYVSSLSFSPDGSLLAAMVDNSIQFWDVATGQVKGEPVSAPGVVELTFSPDGSVLAAGNLYGSVALYDVRSGKLLRELSSYTNRVTALAFSPDGSTLAIGGYGGAVGLWDVPTGQAKGKPMNHDADIVSISFSPDGLVLATSVYYGGVQLWNAQTGALLHTSRRHGAPPYLLFTRDGVNLISASYDSTLLIWDISTAAWLEEFSEEALSKVLDRLASGEEGLAVENMSRWILEPLRIAAGGQPERLQQFRDLLAGAEPSPGKKLISEVAWSLDSFTREAYLKIYTLQSIAEAYDRANQVLSMLVSRGFQLQRFPQLQDLLVNRWRSTSKAHDAQFAEFLETASAIQPERRPILQPQGTADAITRALADTSSTYSQAMIGNSLKQMNRLWNTVLSGEGDQGKEFLQLAEKIHGARASAYQLLSRLTKGIEPDSSAAGLEEEKVGRRNFLQWALGFVIGSPYLFSVEDALRAYENAKSTPDYLQKIQKLRGLVQDHPDSPNAAEALEDLWLLENPLNLEQALITYAKWLKAKGVREDTMTLAQIQDRTELYSQDGRSQQAEAFLKGQLERNRTFNEREKDLVRDMLIYLYVYRWEYEKAISQMKEKKDPDLYDLSLEALIEIKNALDARKQPSPSLAIGGPVDARVRRFKDNPKTPVYVVIAPAILELYRRDPTDPIFTNRLYASAGAKNKGYFEEFVGNVSAAFSYLSGGKFGLELKEVNFGEVSPLRGKIEYDLDLLTSPEIVSKMGKGFVLVFGNPSPSAYYVGNGVVFVPRIQSAEKAHQIGVMHEILHGLGMSHPRDERLSPRGHKFLEEEIGSIDNDTSVFFNTDNDLPRLFLRISTPTRVRLGWPEKPHVRFTPFVPLREDIPQKAALMPDGKSSVSMPAAGMEELTKKIVGLVGIIEEVMDKYPWQGVPPEAFHPYREKIEKLGISYEDFYSLITTDVYEDATRVLPLLPQPAEPGRREGVIRAFVKINLGMFASVVEVLLDALSSGRSLTIENLTRESLSLFRSYQKGTRLEGLLVPGQTRADKVLEVIVQKSRDLFKLSAAGLEERKLNVNLWGAKRIRIHLDTLPAFQSLGDNGRRLLAIEIVRQRPAGGYQDKQDFLDRLIKGTTKTLGVREDQIRSIANSVKFGISRRAFLGWAAATTGGLAVTMSGGKELYDWATASGGRVVWVLGYHVSPNDFREVVNQLQLAEGRPQVIYVGEAAPPDLIQLRKFFPKTVNQITREALDGLAGLWEEVDGSEQVFLERSSPLGRELMSLWKRVGKANEGLLGWLKEDPTRLEVPRIRKSLGASEHLFEYLVKHPEVQTEFESSPFGSFLTVLRMDLILGEASRALFSKRDSETFFRGFADYYRLLQRLKDERDRVFADQLNALLRNNPGATIVISRGLGHVQLTKRVGGYEWERFQVEIKKADRGSLEPYEAALAPYRQALLSDAQLSIPDEKSVRQAVLRTIPFRMLSEMLVLGQAEDGKEAATIAMEVVGELSDEEMGELVEALQDQDPLFTEAAQGSFEDWMNHLSFYAIAWLNERGKLSQDVQKKLLPAAQNLTPKQHEEKLKERVRLQQSAGLEEFSEEALKEVIDRLASGDETFAVGRFSAWILEPIRDATSGQGETLRDILQKPVGTKSIFNPLLLLTADLDDTDQVRLVQEERNRYLQYRYSPEAVVDLTVVNDELLLKLRTLKTVVDTYKRATAIGKALRSSAISLSDFPRLSETLHHWLEYDKKYFGEYALALELTTPLSAAVVEPHVAMPEGLSRSARKWRVKKKNAYLVWKHKFGVLLKAEREKFILEHLLHESQPHLEERLQRLDQLSAELAALLRKWESKRSGRGFEAMEKARSEADDTLDALMSPPPALDDVLREVFKKGVQTFPVKATVIPPGSPDPFEAPWVADNPLDERRERFVIDPLRIFYQMDSAGAAAVNLVQTAIHSKQIPGLRSEDVGIFKLTEGQDPDPYTIVVRAADEVLPKEEFWRQNHVAIITFTPQMTLAQLVREALAQWTGRPIGEILQIDHFRDRLGVYV